MIQKVRYVDEESRDSHIEKAISAFFRGDTMVLTEIWGNIKDIPGIDNYHIETCMVKSDDLHKRILRVTSDHNHEYGIRIDDDGPRLENGSTFKLSDHELLVLRVIPDEMIVIKPNSIDQMGEVAHFLGNLHKPIQVKEGTIILFTDPVVMDALKQQGIEYRVEKRELDNPLSYVDLVHTHAHHHE